MANAPKKTTINVALIFAIVAVLLVVLAKLSVITIPFLTVNAFWILLIGFCVLYAGCILKNL